MSTTFDKGTFTPAPGRGSIVRMLIAQTRTETAVTMRNGEQILVTLLIPIVLLIGLSQLKIGNYGTPRIDFVAPRIFALAIMSSAFTGQAIGLGFDRRYGVLKRLAATALPRWLLVLGRIASAFVVVLIQIVVLSVISGFLGWHPQLTGLIWGAAFVVLGTAAFGGLGILVGGSMRAELVLAVANTVWFVLMLVGGVIFAPSMLPGPMETITQWLPSGALAEALTSVLTHGAFPGWQPLTALVLWSVGSALIATKTTKLT
jgi:ABC-2 type transport system permease protein